MSEIVGCCGSKLIIAGFLKRKRKKTMPQKVPYLSVSTHSDRNFR